MLQHSPRTAIVADWLVTHGGAEHVLDEFLHVLPHATVFTGVVRRGALGPLDAADIRPAFLQTLYRVLKRHEPLLPLFPYAMERIDLTGFDLVVSSSHAVAKGIIAPPGAVHVCYCHTPMRYAWEMERQYLEDFGIPRRLRPAVQRMLGRLRRWDLSTAKRVDTFIANSTTTQARIAKYYGRESIVLPPPVAQRFFATPIPASSSPYFLAIGRMVPYKRFDLLIAVANARGLPLKIAGRGHDEARLRALAGPTVEFLGRVSDEALPALYANAAALLFPQEEDAGIVLLEAHACGTPAIAYGKGGATDALKEGVTGTFFADQTEASLGSALDRFSTMRFDRIAIREHARAFGADRFKDRFSAIVDDAMARKLR